MKTEITRADKLLFQKGLFTSREKAAQAIFALRVKANGKQVTKPSQLLSANAKIELVPAADYVGRGALKLRHALDTFKIDLTGRVCLDVGASTGGFTQVMAQSGAALIYSVDVGSSQLSEELLKDDRIINMGKTDIRNVKQGDLLPKPDFCTVDVSFISLSHVLAHSLNLVNCNECVALIKPQYEAGRFAVSKNGIVKDMRTHQKVLRDCIALARSLGVNIKGIIHSPIAGKSGNREYLIWLAKEKAEKAFVPDIEALVRQAFEKRD